MKNNFKAYNEFVQIEVKELKKGTFSAGESNILEGEIVSQGCWAGKEMSKGDKVIFDKFKSVEYSIEGKKYFFVKHETILAISKK